MKKLTALVLTLTMIFSIIGTIPTMAETVDLEERDVTYIDLAASATADSGKVPLFKDSFKQKTTFFTSNADENSVYRAFRLTDGNAAVNVFNVGTSVINNTTKNATVHFWDITKGNFDVIETGTGTGTRAVIDWKNKTFTAGTNIDTYTTKYYKVNGNMGSYRIGPVVDEDEDPATDVYLAANSVYMRKQITTDGNNTVSNLATNKFEINNSADYVNVMLFARTHNGGKSTLLPIDVMYTDDGNAETADTVRYWVLIGTYSTLDDLSQYVYAFPGKAEGEADYTLSDIYSGFSSDKLLTSAKRTELGISASAISDVVFKTMPTDGSVVIPNRMSLGDKAYNNINSNSDMINNPENTYYVEDITIPVDNSRTIQTISFTNFFGAGDCAAALPQYGDKAEVAPSGKTTYYFTEVEIPEYKGTNRFFARIGRPCNENVTLLAMALSNKTHSEVIAEVNKKIEAATEIEALKAVNSEINAYVEENEGVTRANFDVAALEAKVKEIVNNEIAKAETVGALETLAVTVEGYATTFDIDFTAEQTAIATKIAEIEAEADRVDALDDRTYNHIDFSAQADIDAYVMAQDLGDKARFLYNAAGDSSLKTPWIEGNEATYTYTPDGATEEKTINLWIPETTHKGASVKVTDEIYKKGLLIFRQYDTDGDGVKDWARDYPSYIFFMDQLIVDKTAGTDVEMSFYRFAGNKATNTNKQYTEDTFSRTLANIKFTPDNVEKVEQIGDNYYSYVKNGDVMYKIGPMNKTVFTPNTLSLSNDAVIDDVVEVNAQGTRLDLMLTVNDVNQNSGSLKNKADKVLYDSNGVSGTYGGYKAAPIAGLQKVVINYEDGSNETKYILLRNTQISTDYTSSYYKTNSEVEYSFIYAPKYDDERNEIVYDGSSVGAVGSEFKILNEENATADSLYKTGVTEIPGAEAVKFYNKDIVVAEAGKLARTTQHRMDTSSASYGHEAMAASILLDSTKTVTDVKFVRDTGAAKKIGIALTDATNCAIIPAEIEGLSDEYVYYAYCGRLGDGNFLMAATLSSANEDKALRASQEILETEKYADAQAIVAKYIDGTIIKTDDLTTEAKAKLADLEEAFNRGLVISAIDVSEGVATVTYENGTGESISAIIIVAQYNDDETELKSVKTHIASFAHGETTLTQEIEADAANKVKVLIWKDLINFFPYK